MKQVLSILVIILLWIISFVEQSGWAISLHLPEKINFIIALAAIICHLTHPKRNLVISLNLFLLILFFLVLIPFLKSLTWHGASYLSAFLTTYIVSQCRITDNVIKYTSIAIAGLGLLILYTYVYGSILNGWNDNAISMIGLFSYIFFSMFLISKHGQKSFYFWNIITLFYLLFLFKTDCRSAILFSMLALVTIYYSRWSRKVLSHSKLRVLMLNTPFIISLIVIAFASLKYFDLLNYWSLETFDKPIFNGREILWKYAYELLEKSYYLGTGEFVINYHNSGVAAITVFGIMGYICWMKFFNDNLNLLSQFLSDNIVFGSMLAFLLIFLQQSLELGFISEYPNLLPYTILGIGLGRVRLLQKKES